MTKRINGVSVIVTTYNGEKWIVDAINSILNQDTDLPLELIIVDDGSSDNTLDMIKGLTDPRIKLIVNESNRGVPTSRNIGVGEATHDWLAFNDQDDIWFLDKLSKQIRFLEEHPDIDVVSGGRARLAKDGVSRWRGRFLFWSWSPVHYPDTQQAPYYNPIKEGTVYLQTFLMAKSAIRSIGGFRENLPIAYDPDLCLRLADVVKMGIIFEPVFLYRLGEESITATMRSKCTLSGFAYCYASQKARSSSEPEPDIEQFLQSYEPSKKEMESFVLNAIMRKVNLKWVNHGFFSALLEMLKQIICSPRQFSLFIISRLRWWLARRSA